MKAKVYIAPTQYAYRAAEDGQSIQFLDTTLNLGWKHSDYMTDKVLKAARPAQEVLDEEAARRGWQPWEEPKEQADKAQSNAVQLAAILVDQQKKRSGEMTAEGFKKGLGTGGSARSQGFIDYDYKGVSIRPIGEPETKYTWAKFLKFCRENGLIEEKPLKVASKPVSEQAEENPIHAAEDAPTCAPTVSDAQPSPPPSVGVDAKTEVDADDLPEVCHGCQCATCGNKGCVSPCWTKPNEVSSCERIGPAGVDCKDYQPKSDVFPENAETPTSSPAATAAAESTAARSEPQADAGTMTAPAVSDSAAAGLAVGAKAVLPSAEAFDYTGLDQPTVDTLHLAERMIRDARRDYITKLAQAVYIVHDALCGSCDKLSQLKHGNRGEESFGAWCAYVGISRKTGERLLQVAALLNGSTPEEQAVLEAACPSLLYAAAKPSAPAQLVEGVKSGDITTHKQYQALLAQLKAKDQELAAERADREAERASTSALLADEQHRRQEAEQARIAAEKAAQGAKESYRVAQKNETLAIKRAKEAESQLSGARNALTAAKARGDRWQEKCEALEAQAAAPAIEARVVDPEEVEQLAAERAEALAAQQMAQRDAEDARAAYDAVILATRSMDAAWQALAPMLPRLAPEEKGQAIHQFVNKLMCIKEDVLKCL